MTEFSATSCQLLKLRQFSPPLLSPNSPILQKSHLNIFVFNFLLVFHHSSRKMNSQFNSVIMAICTAHSRCGAAVYTDSVVHILADRVDRNDPYKGLDLMIQKIQPEVIVLSSVQRKLIDYVKARFNSNILDISNQRATQSGYVTDQNFQEQEVNQDKDIFLNCESSFKLVIVPNMWFSMSRGFQKLTDSEIIKSKGLRSIEEKTLLITSKIEKSADVCALRSIAAIDSYITFAVAQRAENEMIATQSQGDQQVLFLRSQQTQTNQESNPNCDLMTIVDIQYIDPGPVLSIDKFTLEALGIFHKIHGNRNRFCVEDDSPETIPSLFEILNQCTSPQGKRQLQSMMMWPLQDINELTRRHDTVEFFIQPDNMMFRDQISIHLKNVTPLANVIAHLNLAIGNYNEFVTLYKALWSFVAIMDIIKSNKHNLAILDRITELDSSELRTAIDSIMNVIDFEQSKLERRIQVSDGVDLNVDDKKEVIKNLTKFCDEVAIEETAKYKDILGKICRVLYVPRIGFLNSIDYSSTSELMSIRTNKEFDILLYTEQSVYFKTQRMEQLDNNAGDLACDLIDVQEDVLVKLQEDILKHTDTILKLMELCGELDCLIAFSLVTSQRGYTRPEFSSSSEEILIKQAYHPLHSTKYNIVPNDIRFFNQGSHRKVKVMIITGPNSCGKTTYMKAACLVVYMAHIGCFVPAMQARMPIVDAILTRMHSANSISTGLSSFATDVHQINYAIRKATNRSLIVVDEFGKGTRASDGFHLLKGLIIYFANRLQESPYVIISTHFNRLVNHLQNYHEYILYKTFKISKDLVKQSIMYEFLLIDGVGEVSLADKVALAAGVPQQIIERASQIRDYITSNRQIRPMAPRGA